jgi:hypothetical protein
MLDECKGERLEEVLAVFSNAVLKRVLQQQQSASGEHEAIALELAFKNFSYSGERSMLSSLILAHKASINGHLREKGEYRAKYNDFSELLRLNERRILRRHEQLKEALAESDHYDRTSPSEIKSLQTQVQKNWSGSEAWLGTILYSDSKVGEGGLLATTFERVWKHVEDGNIGDVESAGKLGLLEQLDARVKTQENRLGRWKEFCHTLSKSGEKLPVRTQSFLPSNIVPIRANPHPRALRVFVEARNTDQTYANFLDLGRHLRKPCAREEKD